MADEELGLLVADDGDEDEGDGQEWLATFADISMLLMVFFVLLYSMSNLDEEKFSDAFVSVKNVLGGKESKMSTAKMQQEVGQIIDQVRVQKEMLEAQKKVFTDVQFFNTQKGLEGVVGAYFEDGVITLRAPSNALFASGQVQLTAKGKKVVRTLKDFFVKHMEETINIRGYTDNVPPSKRSRFRDNWEISALRAVNVLRYLVALGLSPNRLTATGLADLDPLYPNNNPENRAKNRRVEFVLERRVTGADR